MELKSWHRGHVKQMVLWCDELTELQALESFLATALADADSHHCRNASILVGQLQRRLQCLSEQMYATLCQLRASPQYLSSDKALTDKKSD